MKIETAAHSDYTVISIAGEIDMYSSPELRDTLLALVKKKAATVIVNLKDVKYIDSSGIATFVEALKKMLAYKGKFKMAQVPDRVMEIFNFSKLDKVFNIYGSIEDAANS
ncbi:MAG: STAS domain-containing protein [Nitrospirota bacterium]|uniref:Anti-sigma factor antagonist n=1 Tax=Candidatus Magnetominusculus xianensis TaxID=1748249 RepID=A0ABR5SLK8_9BACT|nr:STAS domain-containing protein [Candidatus Magnetominusculus xianensis]KWT91021.1 anti-anti-sigma-B factor [Candidatus Magnetominusculus xianensis]MBF0402586.1 STAS domain-containing protein [Nitrospirota bacterium]